MTNFLAEITRLWTSSIKRQLMIGIILVHAVMMSIFVFDLYSRQQSFLHTQSIDQAQSLANTLAISSVSWILANDVIGLEEVVQAQLGYPDLQYAIVISPNGRILSHTDISKTGMYLSDEISIALQNSAHENKILVNSDDLIDVVSPVYSNDQFIGWSRVGLGQSKITTELFDIKFKGFVYTALAILIGALFALFMSKGMTYGLRHLVSTAEGIKKGNLDLRSDLDRHDEIGQLSEAFNLMLNTIRSNKLEFQAILDYSPVLIYTTDLEGKYSLVNQHFQRLTKTDIKEFVGLTPKDLFPDQTAEMMITHDLDAHSGQMKVEEIIENTDGSKHTYLSIKFPLNDDAGNLTGIGSISTDITERQKMEDVIRRTQKLDALGKLTGGIAHDFNNLLAVIIGYSELLETSLNADTKLHNFAQQITRASRRGANLTKKLLAFTSSRVSDACSVSIKDILIDMETMLTKTFTARINLNLNIEDKLWNVNLDSSELEDAILNLCINSMHAISDTGVVTISARNSYIDYEKSQILQLIAGDYISLSISDDGQGMNDEVKDKMFDPFFSTKGKEGTGLGLSQVYGFVERCGGAVEVVSTLDIGTEVTLYFPRCYRGKPTNIDIAFTEENDGIEVKETILLVDDEVQLLQLSSEVLTRQGYSTFIAENGKEALIILENEDIDLMLSDIIMPNMNGYQLAAIVQKKYPTIKILLASGYTNVQLPDGETLELEQEILHKPYQIKTLLTTIKKMLDD